MEIDARIASIRQQTPTIKSFLLDFGTEEFAFLPGQWVDLYVPRPGEENLLGGFTLVSSPTYRGVVELAIKRVKGSRTSAYLHDHAQVGDPVIVVGPQGGFYFQEGMTSSLVLIAGGIGINPMISIVRYIDARRLSVRMTLFYSAKTPSELLFSQELRAMAGSNPLLRCYLTVTQPGHEPWQGRVGRIDKEMLHEALGERDTLYYLCGPPGMPTTIAGILRDLQVPQEAIRFEEW